ncbi:MAG: hypothetical protein GY838_13650 [bacterium]|nr:hypothetical protein [bacterium]
MPITYTSVTAPSELAIAPGPVAAGGPVRISYGDDVFFELTPGMAEQGRRILVEPDLSNVVDGTLDAVRTAGASNAISIGGQGAFVTVVDGDADAGEVINSVAGRLVLTTNDKDDDNISICLQGGGAMNAPSMKVGPFLPVAASEIVFGIKAKISDATQTDLLFGLTVCDAEPVGGVTDGIYFLKGDADTQPDLVLEKNSTATTTAMLNAAGAAAAVADNTYFTAGFIVQGLTTVTGYWDGVATNASAVTNIDDDERLYVNISIVNGEAAAKTLTIEKLFCYQTMI